MPPVIKAIDQNDLVPSKNYPYGTFPFEKFNPIQSRVIEYYDKNTNAIIAASTSSGKTIVSELFMAHEIRVKKKPVIYMSPLRALCQEKYDDWTDKKHHFHDLKVSICTGDWKLTPDRQKELEEANIIIITYEMLNLRARNAKSEKSRFLQEIGVLVCDEVHSLAMESRGPHLENALMKFTEINTSARLVLLSATMPNVNEIADWTSYVLTQKDTFLLTSTYRPCPLNIHYEKYKEVKYYDGNEQQKVNQALEIIKYYPDDKFLIFVHTKKTGELIKKAVQSLKIDCEFHNADLDKESRIKLEQKFKNDPKFRVIVATSTLSTGLNLPARRVIVVGVHRGLNEVTSSDIWQAAGRAGRPAYDPVGDAYILLPEGTFDMHKARLKKPEAIRSQMLENVGGKYKVLAFHIVSEIHQGEITDREGVIAWYKRSLAAFQAYDLEDSIIDSTIDSLKKCGAIWEEDGKFTVTAIGKIASLFYFSPFDVSDLKRNFTFLFDQHKEDDDLYTAIALGNLDSLRAGIVSRAERDEMSIFANKVALEFGKGIIFEPAIKAAFAYDLMLNGRSNNHFSSMVRTLQFDFQRLQQVLYALDGFGAKWAKKDYFDKLGLRATYGVKGEMVSLCVIKEVGRVRANKLWNAGLKTISDVANNPDKVLKLLGNKIGSEVVKDAAIKQLMA